MSKEENNKAIIGRWFTDFWGQTCNLGIVDELAAPDMLLQYSLHAPRKGHADIKAFMADFRKAFPDLGFSGAADLLAEGDHVVCRSEGGDTHISPRPRTSQFDAPSSSDPTSSRFRARGLMKPWASRANGQPVRPHQVSEGGECFNETE